MSKKALLFSALASPAFADDIIILEDFTMHEGIATHQWRQTNDPVMGGESTGTFTIDDGVGVFDGEVVDVPFLAAPGFIKVIGGATDGIPFPDISSCTSLGIKARNTDQYDGYRISLGNARPPAGTGAGFFTAGHKAPFFVNENNTVTVPLKEFSNAWDDATGDILVECADDERLCLTEKILKDVGQVQVWGEGRAGPVHLEIEQIFATGCNNVANADAAVKSVEKAEKPTMERKLVTPVTELHALGGECPAGSYYYAGADCVIIITPPS